MVLLYWKISLSSARGHNNVVKGHAHKLKNAHTASDISKVIPDLF